MPSGVISSMMAREYRSIPFSLSDLADYICSDRSAMMRELKRLREEGFLEISGRNVRFKTGLCAASFPTQ